MSRSLEPPASLEAGLAGQEKNMFFGSYIYNSHPLEKDVYSSLRITYPMLKCIQGLVGELPQQVVNGPIFVVQVA